MMDHDPVTLYIGVSMPSMTVEVTGVKSSDGVILVEAHVDGVPLSEVHEDFPVLQSGEGSFDEDFVWLSVVTTVRDAVMFLEWLRKREACQITMGNEQFWRMFNHSQYPLASPGSDLRPEVETALLS